MVYKDGGKFTTYCDKPYDQNDYVVHLTDGREVCFSSYAQMMHFWFNGCHTGLLEHVSIKDVAK